MAEPFIEEIYQYARVVSELRKAVYLCREMDREHALEGLKEMFPELHKILQECQNDHYEETDILQEKITLLHTSSDFTVIFDVIENAVIPIIERWIQTWVNVAEQVDERYEIESASSGFMTIRNSVAGRYLHSNNDPMMEAWKLVRKQYRYEKQEYLVWGCGLGYHIYQLYRLSEGTIPITVYEPDVRMIQYAIRFGVLSWIPSDRLEIVALAEAIQFLQAEKETSGVLFLLPYLNSMGAAEEKHLLMQRYIRHSITWEMSRELNINFCRNKELKLPDICELDASDMKQDMVIVGGGPSVDGSIEELRRWKGEKTIIAVGTIWKRLLKEGICPDYAVMMDPSELIYAQVQGIQNINTTLLLNISAYWKIARTYQGRIYTICVETSGCDVVSYAREHNMALWESGGTVTALAMEIAIRHGARRIFMTGVDLAFPGGFSHAQGTNFRREMDISKLKPIRSMSGETVYSDDSFTLYRNWIEYRIAQNNSVQFVNLSEQGAWIKGTIPYKDFKKDDGDTK